LKPDAIEEVSRVVSSVSDVVIEESVDR
jgi:hypothetical protein